MRTYHMCRIAVGRARRKTLKNASLSTVRLGRALDPKPSIFAHFGRVWLPPFSATGCFRPRSSSFRFCLMSLSYDNTPCLLISILLRAPLLVSILLAWCLPSPWMSAPDTNAWPGSSFIASPSPLPIVHHLFHHVISDVSLAIFRHIIHPTAHQSHSVPLTS